MDFLGLLSLLQQGSRQTSSGDAGAAGAVVILMLLGIFIASLAFNWFIAWLVSNAAKSKRCSSSDVSMVFWITFFLGPIIGLIVLSTRKPGQFQYNQPGRGRPMGRPGGRQMGPRRGGGPRPGGPRLPGGRGRGPTLPQGMQQQQYDDGYDQQGGYDQGYQQQPAYDQGYSKAPAPPPQQQAPPGFIFCPRCGQQNGVQRDDCWSCGLGFHPSMKEGAGAEDQPVGGYSNQSGPGEETVKQVQTVGEETVTQQNTPDVTERILKVACNACGKKFSGPESKVARVRKCPKCGVEPFEFTSL